MGVRGEPSKTGAQSALLLVRLSFASSLTARGDLFVTQKGGDAKRPLTCAASAVAEAMAGQAASQARLPHGGILFYTNRAPNKRSAVEAHK